MQIDRKYYLSFIEHFAMKHFFLILTLNMMLGCKTDKPSTINQDNLKRIEAVTPLGDTLYSYSKQDSFKLVNYNLAKDDYDSDNGDPEHIIWLGRRLAYMGKYREAIDVYEEGIVKFPDEPRMYRHRGHRYITLRKYDDAIKDLEKACELIIGTENMIEPDGIPNAQGVPISSLHGNIYYHLALAYYLKGDLNNALRVYDLLSASDENDDNLVSTTHWKYMSLRRAGHHDEATRLLTKIDGSLKVIENISYWEMCLFYKGILKEEWFVKKIESKSNKDVFLYGLGNWHMYGTKDTVRAKGYFERLVREGNMASFAYLAAEADLMKIQGKQLVVWD